MDEYAKTWILQAEADIDSANHCLKGKKYYVAIFLSQQASEKALKAVIINQTEEFPKVHDLVYLAKKCDAIDLLKSCEELNAVYTETRYPTGKQIPSQKFSAEDARHYLKLAGEILLWAKKKLSNS